MLHMRMVNSLILAASLGSGVALAEQSADADDDSQNEGSVTQQAEDTDSGSGDDESLGKPYAEDSESVAGTVDESGSGEGRENEASGDQSAGASGNSGDQSAGGSGDSGDQSAGESGTSGDQRSGADSERPGNGGTGFLEALGDGQLLGGDILGSTLVNTSDEEVGEIDELVIGRDGRLIAVVVGVGGMLGLGEKSVAVAWDELEIVPATDDGKPAVRTTLDRDALEAAPELGD